MDDGGQHFILLVGAYILLCILMFLLGIAAQTVARFSDTHLERLARTDNRAVRIQNLQKNTDELRFKCLLIQIFGGVLQSAVIYTAAAKPIKDLYLSLFKNTYTKSAAVLTVLSLLLVETLFIGIYSAVCTELTRRATKSGRFSGENGEHFALRNVWFLRFMYALFLPLTLIGMGALKLFSHPLKVRTDITDETGEDLIQLIDAQSENGGIEEDQAEMISNIFEFSDLELHDVMTHRTEITAANIGVNVAEVVRIAVESGFSRIPIYRETIDDICGVIYIKDLLPLILAHDAGEIPAAKFIHKIKYVPESGNCGELFTYFTENKRQIAVVLDEYGGTAGLVTMEDLLESIVGNICDEYDENEEEEIQEITPHTFDILGSADPEEVMQRLNRQLDDDIDFDTMGGFITHLLGYIPEDGQTADVRWKDITFGIISAKDNRIERIRAVIDK